MADHSKPTLTDNYADWPSLLDGRFDDLAVGMDPAVTTVTNPPIGAIRWTSSANTWQKWNGTAWSNLSSNYTLPRATIAANASDPALTITQTGSGYALLVEDEASPDSTPFVVDSAGRVGMGDIPTSQAKVRMAIPMTGNATQIQVYSDAQLKSDGTGVCRYFYTSHNTQAATFTAAAIIGYQANQGAFGAGSTVTNQYGFYAASSLTGAATGNYGFYSELAAGTGRWNFYAAGTANNAFAGSVSIGSASAPSCALDVTGGIKTSRTTVTMPAASDGNVFSGSYTPASAAANTNVSAITCYVSQYTRLGDVVSVSLHVSITPTATGTTIVHLTLPVPSNFTQASGRDGAGVLFDYAGGQVARVWADATTDCLQITYNATATTAREFSGTFQYIIK